MKTNLRKIKQLLFLFTMLLLVSCSSDIYEQQIEKSNKTMKMLNRSEIVKIPKLASKLNQIKSTQNKVHERIVADTTYNFSVDTNSAIYVSSGASETYTFNVIRKNGDNKIENLILIANLDGTFRTLLIKYGFTNSDREALGFNPMSFDSPKYTEIEADYSELINNKCVYRSDYICVDTYEYGRIETNGGNNAGGALFYYGWSVTATNCTFVTQSDGCGGGDSNLILTFETSPIHTNGGYSGVTVALSTNQRTFINALNIMSSENFGIMNGDVQMSILNYVNTLTNGQISSVVYFFNYANTTWISSQSDETQQSIFNYLIANNFSTQSRDKINQLINVAVATNSSFTIDPTITSTNGQVFNSTNELQNYLTSLSSNLTTEITSDTQGNTKVGKIKRNIGAFTFVTIEVNQTLIPYAINGVSSYISGNTLCLSYNQATPSNLVQTTTNNNVVTLSFSSTLNINALNDNIGTLWTYDLTIIVKVNKLTGEIISMNINGLP